MDEKTYVELVERLTDLEIVLTKHTETLSPVQRVSGSFADVIEAFEQLKYKIAGAQL